MDKRIFAPVGGLFAMVALASCSGNGNNPQTVTTVNPLSGKLQLAVGTANIFGTTTGLNVVETFRQPQGAQAPGDTDALVNTPSLTGPFTLPTTVGTPDGIFGATIATGPSSGEAGKASITATPQQNPGIDGKAIPPSTFGVAGGATGLGLEPFNYTTTGTSSNSAGIPASFVPYAVPAYDTIATDPNAFVPWGGPPAFDPNKDGKGERDNLALDPNILGVSEGLDVFAGVAPVVGTYTLNVNIATSNSPGTGTATTTARLNSAALLPAVTAPVVASLDGNGGGTFTATLPAGVTEGYIQIEDIGPPTTGTSTKSCNGSDAKPVYYTIHVTASGSYVLPPTSGPGNPGTTTPSICTSAQNTASNSGTTDGDQFTLQLVGFDYPVYAASYPNSNGNPAPVIAGPSGQADVTISTKAGYLQPAGGTVTPALRVPMSELSHRLITPAGRR